MISRKGKSVTGQVEKLSFNYFRALFFTETIVKLKVKQFASLVFEMCNYFWMGRLLKNNGIKQKREDRAVCLR